MKKLFIAIVALLAMVACSKSDVMDVPQGGSSLTVGFEQPTRVYVGEGLKLAWNNGDLLSVFTTSANHQYKFTGADGAQSGSIDKVSGEDGAAIEKTYAVYPYAETVALEDGVLSLELPAVQQYKANSFGVGANTMVAVAESTSLSFKNVCGYICLQLTGEGAVKSLKLEGNKGEIIAGEATVDMNDNAKLAILGDGTSITLDCGTGVELSEEPTTFWFAVPPTTFEKGFKITVTDENGIFEKATLKNYVVERNKVKTMNPIESAGIGGEVIFDAKFNADGSATDLGKYGMAIDAIEGSKMAVVSDDAYPYGNVVKFTHEPNNFDNADSFYLVDYAEEAEFQADLEDGFSMEFVVKHGYYLGNFWVRPVSTNTFGLLAKGAAQGFTLSLPSTDQVGMKYENIDMIDKGLIPSFESYTHYVYVYDSADRTFQLYCNGVCIRERYDLPFAAGDKLAIGGFPLTNGQLAQPFMGNVAMVRIYNDVLAADDIAKRYEVLNLPKESVTINTPLFDAEFGENGAAENAGSYSSLSLTALANTKTKSVAGFGYVATFDRGISNNAYEDGYYMADFASDETFKGKLKDGFTMEMLVSSDDYAPMYAGFARPFGTQSFGILRQDNGTNEYMCYWNQKGEGRPDTWWYAMDGYTADRPGLSVIPEIKKYSHILFVYLPEMKNIRVYVDGKIEGVWGPEKGFGYNFDFDLYTGTRFAIGGFPMTDGETKFVTQIWNGDVAIARVYDEPFSNPQAVARFESLESTIQTLEAAQ